jgi:putative transcriptional regulator
MTLQNGLKELRLDRGYTQEALAREVGVSRQSIFASEKGKYRPTVELALRLALALGSSVEEIFWLEENQGEG